MLANCTCSQNQCTYYGNVIISENITITSNIVIENDLIISPNVIIILNKGINIIVQGTATIDGTITLNGISNPGNIPVIISTEELNGQFNQINFTNSSINGCNKLEGTQNIDENTLSILVESNCGISVEIIAIIIIATIIGGILIGAAVWLLWRYQRNQVDGFLKARNINRDAGNI